MLSTLRSVAQSESMPFIWSHGITVAPPPQPPVCTVTCASFCEPTSGTEVVIIAALCATCNAAADFTLPAGLLFRSALSFLRSFRRLGVIVLGSGTGGCITVIGLAVLSEAADTAEDDASVLSALWDPTGVRASSPLKRENRSAPQ